MTDKYKPIWHRLITQFKSEGIIDNGLTPPFLAGAMHLIDESFPINENSMKLLLDEIINSTSGDVAVLHACAVVDQGYVIAIKTRKEVNAMSKGHSFHNPEGEESFCISKDASNLGDTIDAISNKLNEMYLQLLREGKFSWGLPIDQKDYCNKLWREFNPTEKEVIRKLVN